MYDANGNVVEQLSIDIPRTKAIAQALRENNLHVGIAQHGITGTPGISSTCISPRATSSRAMSGRSGRMWRLVS